MLAVSVENPHPAGCGEIQIPSSVDFDPIERFVAWNLARQIDERFAGTDTSVPAHPEAGHGLGRRIPVADIQVILIGREGDSVRTLQVPGDELQLSGVPAEYAAPRQLLP